MRVVAGELRGRHLRGSVDRGTRPTADKVREALFSILADVSGLRVLDLFAGSGALGIEALSRGAASAEFVERAPRAVAALRRNLADLRLEARVHRADALDFLRRAQARGATYDLVFCDPPYDCAPALAAPLSERLAPVLAEDARIVTESDKRAPLELSFSLVRERTYGRTRIAVLDGR